VSIRYPPVTQRKGTVFTYRKGALFLKDAMQKLHKDSDIELLPGASNDRVVELFRSHEYFVCYDPHSWLVFMAAQLGCIPIVHPLPNVTKYQWVLSAWFGGYLHESGLKDVQGIAYGWEDEPHARATLNNTRREQFAAKAWGHETIRRMGRDVRQYLADSTAGFETEVLYVRDFFPRNSTPVPRERAREIEEAEERKRSESLGGVWW